MRLAVLSDIHGNADALAEVLADLKGQAPDAVVNLGDLYAGPLDVARTCDLLAGARIDLTVRGNHDRMLALGPRKPWDAAALPHLTQATLTALAALPATAVLGDVFLCHGTPQDDATFWLEQRSGRGLVRAPLARIEALAQGLAQRVLLCGHSHVARTVRLGDGRLVVNPGSVGCPGYQVPGTDPYAVCSGSNHAVYAVLDHGPAGWTVAHRQVPYDTAPAVALARARGFDDWAQVLATGWLGET